MSQLQLVITDTAQDDLGDIWDYRAEYDIASADKLIDRIVVHCRLIVTMPRMGTPRDDLAPGIRATVIDRYMVFYRVDAHQLVVARILKGQRHLPDFF